MVEIFPVATNENLENIKMLFVEYTDSLGFDLDFQNFDDELANLPSDYAPPTGCPLIARYQGKVVGCMCRFKILK